MRTSVLESVDRWQAADDSAARTALERSVGRGRRTRGRLTTMTPSAARTGRTPGGSAIPSVAS